jgi:hypothetical protein
VIVADALAGGVTVAGLMLHAGGSVAACPADDGVTWQLRSTVPLKPLSVPTVMFADDVPPGGTAFSEREGACRVKVWADAADGNVRSAVHRHRTASPAGPPRTMNLDFDSLNFSMSRFRFK